MNLAMDMKDSLTGLYNQRFFFTQLGRETRRVNRHHHSLALLMLDIDNFKQYNDTYGHREGNKVLEKLGSILQKLLRSTDSAYRYGGEEFVVLLPETNGEQATVVAERIRKALLEVPFLPGKDKKVQVTVSIGVAQYPPTEDEEKFIRMAGHSLYSAKKQGKNRVVLESSQSS